MAGFTKQAICNSFLKLLRDKPLEQITVKDIVEDCGVNRKTFYYYYQDMFALMEEYAIKELERIKAELPENASWQEAQKALSRAMLENRGVMLHITRSMDDATLQKISYDLAMATLPRFIRKLPSSADADEEDILLIADLYSMSLACAHARWLRSGMKEDPGEMIDRIAAIMQGATEIALQNAVRLKRNK